jgi:hypothetical protein
LAVQLECQYKGGQACLCGFAEFGTPSQPPNLYKTRTISGLMYKGTWSVAACPQSSNWTHQYTLGWTGNVNDSYRNETVVVTGSVTITPTPSGGPFTQYTAVVANLIATGQTTHQNIAVWTDVGTGWVGNGTYAGISWPGSATAFNIKLAFDSTQPYGGGTAILTGRQYTVGGTVPITSIRDSWNEVDDYSPGLGQNPPVCEISPNDHSAEYEQDGGEFPLAQGGNAQAWPGGSPPDVYGSLVTQTVSTQTEQAWQGTDACTRSGATYVWVQGTVTEQLTNPDSESDAISRNQGAMVWSPCITGCVLACSAYQTVRGPTDTCLYWRNVQVRGHLNNLVSGKSYTVRFSFARRGTIGSGAFTPFSYTEVTVSATGNVGTTNWVDVPNESGYETIISNVTCLQQ